MTVMRRAMILLLPLLLLTGCSAPTPDTAFVSTVKESVPVLADSNDQELVALGEQVCALFDDYGFDAGFVEIVSEWKDAGISTGEAGTIIGAATGAYCPEYSDNL